MRVFVQYHLVGSSGSVPLVTQLEDATGGVFFCSLPDGGEPSLQALQDQLAHTARTKRVQLPGHIAAACLVARRRRKEADDEDADAAVAGECFRIESASDACEVRADDHLHVLFRVDDGTRATITALQPLSVTHASRPRSHAETLLAALDDIDPVCHVPRSEDERLFGLDEVAAHATMPWASEARVAFAAELRTICTQFGFARLRFTVEQMAALDELAEAQRTFFALPRDEKLRNAPFAGRNSSYQIPFGYSQKDECRKQFFVVRQPPASQAGTHIDFSLPANPANFAPSAMRALRLLGEVCQQLMTLLLQSLGIPKAKVEALLANTMAPPNSIHDLGYTSVIELFHYIVGEAVAAVSNDAMTDDSAAAASSSSAASPSAALSTSSSPPPLPCSIHSDASLLTLIPRCVGAPGLQLWNTRAADWQAVEAQSTRDEAIVFIGDMFARVTNDAIMPTQHRVVFQPTGSGGDNGTPSSAASAAVSPAAASPSLQHRYSFPFELFLAPRTIVDCGVLLADSPDLLPIRAENAAQTAQDALADLSRARISVNQTHQAQA